MPIQNKLHFAKWLQLMWEIGSNYWMHCWPLDDNEWNITFNYSKADTLATHVVSNLKWTFILKYLSIIN